MNDQSFNIFSPGRVNLIGEHTDYNGGFVFPAAINLGLNIKVNPRRDRRVQIYSSVHNQMKVIELANVKASLQVDDWIAYPAAMLKVFQDEGYALSGCDMELSSTLPVGAGLSSSASLLVGLGYAWLTLTGRAIDRTKLALMAQQAENQYIGVQCGIMDQYVIAHGQQDHAVLLHCQRLEHQLVPLVSEQASIIITNTNKSRGLVDSAYNERRKQCEQALSLWQGVFPEITTLGEVKMSEWLQHKHLLNHTPLLLKRATHVISENDRTQKSAELLRDSKVEEFGKLMKASHRSLRDDYEVSCMELDSLFEAALLHSATIGSRMTGAGFGGCTASLIKPGMEEEWIDFTGEHYKKNTGRNASFYICKAANGVHLQDMGTAVGDQS